MRVMKKSWVGVVVYFLGCAAFHPPGLFSEKERPHEEEEAATFEGPTPPRKPRGWKCMPFIIGNETFEKVASYGLTTNLTVYLVGQFGMKQITAANVANIFFGTTNFTPLIGAFISDAYWGRFRTLAVASIASFLGMVAFTITASVSQLHPTICSELAQVSGQCVRPTKTQLGVLFFSLGLLAVGSGGVRPCSLPFGVDQFDGNSEHGQRSLNSFFNWYYCTSTVGVVISMTVIVYIQDTVSWPVGFAIPTSLMLLAIILFFLGTRLYIYVPPEGSVFSGIAQVFVASFKKRVLEFPSLDDVQREEPLLYDPPTRSLRITKLPLTQQYRFLNKAAIKCEGERDSDGSSTNPWRLCSIQQVEEVKCLIRIIPIWASGIICLVALTQQLTFTVLQSLEMDRHLGPHFQIPAGSIGTIGLITLSLFIPIYDRIFVPLARSITKTESGITLLQRQGVGMVISIASMAVAGLVEHKRRDSAVAHGGSSPMSALWLAPQLILVGLAEAFNLVGQIEFYNRQFPEHMQTLAGSLLYCSVGGASYLSTLLVMIIQKITSNDGRKTGWLDDNINNGRVDYYYYVIGVMGVVSLLYFLYCAHSYRYKGTQEAKEDGIVP